MGGRHRQEEAERLYRQSLEIERSISDRHGEAMVLNSLGGVLVELGGRHRQEEAERLYRQSLEILRSIEDRRGEAMINYRLARLAESRGDFAQAYQHLEHVVSIDEELRNFRYKEQNLKWLAELRRKLDG